MNINHDLFLIIEYTISALFLVYFDKSAFSYMTRVRKYSFLSLQTCKQTTDIGALQKAADFVRAFTLGFEVDVSL